MKPALSKLSSCSILITSSLFNQAILYTCSILSFTIKEKVKDIPSSSVCWLRFNKRNLNILLMEILKNWVGKFSVNIKIFIHRLTNYFITVDTIAFCKDTASLWLLCKCIMKLDCNHKN